MTITTQDTLDRILQRLDGGEELTSCALKDGDKFCIMGLFLDEFGYDWTEFDLNKDPTPAYMALENEVSDYFNFRFSGYGAFESGDLPEELRERILTLVPNYDQKIFRSTRFSLMAISDMMTYHRVQDTNILLADIIRSGVLFGELEP